jgi:cullin-associated NEDD8-dissociated protein 1
MFCGIQAVIAAVNDPFYKITSEALLVLQNLIKVIRPFNEGEGHSYFIL